MSISLDGTATMDQVANVISLAQSDPAFRNQLLTSPETALQSQGITMPPGASLQVLENSSTLANIVIPSKPANVSVDAAHELALLESTGAVPHSALDAFAKLVIDAWEDWAINQQLQSNLGAVLRVRGIMIPAGLRVNAVQSSDTASYVVVPAATSSSLGGVADTVTANFGNLAQLITAGSYLAGMAFSMSSIVKFKSHQDDPTQIPVGTPIALVFIAAALLFIPSVLSRRGTIT
jgi:hypothetical protein